MSTNDILPDVLIPNLKLVICGSAVSTQSSQAGSYYAGQNNKFWRILHETGLTDRLIHTADYNSLLGYGIGLTDVAKKAAGVDAHIQHDDYDAAAFAARMEHFKPRIICFNGKKAAAVFRSWQHGRIVKTKELDYGICPQPTLQYAPILFVAPSTSAAAQASWNPAHWHQLAEQVRRLL
jgi:TDG/mug DNA glycosylase family protein